MIFGFPPPDNTEYLWREGFIEHDQFGGLSMLIDGEFLFVYPGANQGDWDPQRSGTHWYAPGGYEIFVADGTLILP